MLVRSVDPDDQARADVERMISTVYLARYNARVTSFPDRLCASFNPEGEVVCAAGVRNSDTGFFSEVYLENPIEKEIARKARMPVLRSSVLEVTTLAATRPGYMLPLVDFIVSSGQSTGKRWGFFTATRPLRCALRRLNLGLIELASAYPSRLSYPETWGRYYETAPSVCAVAGQGLGILVGNPAQVLPVSAAAAEA